MTGWNCQAGVEDRCKVRRPSCASSRTERRYLNPTGLSPTSCPATSRKLGRRSSPEIWPMGGCATISHGAHSGSSREPPQEEHMTAENTPEPTAPDTIVLIHGLWVTPRSWEKWVERCESRGYRVLTPAYPGFEVEVEALNEDPSPIEALTIPAVVEHLENIVGELDNPPIIMGHSAGGLFTQILLDHGYGAAGVAIDSAPAEGVRVTPVSQIRSLFPILKNPANRH